MGSKNPQNPQCKNCNKEGLAILPVRYSVVPKKTISTLPSGLGAKVTDVSIQHHQYALRVLRQGYVYVYYERHPSNVLIKWETYGVSEAGYLWKMNSHLHMAPAPSDPTCARSGHNLPASVIVIPNPEKCGKVWIAFSDHPWSGEIYKEFQLHPASRARRMQPFEPEKWLSSGKYPHCLPATESDINQVLEYDPSFDPAWLNESSGFKGFTAKNGSAGQAKLEREVSRYPVRMRKGESAQLVKVMNEIGTSGEGPSKKPALIALWDAIGITHELNNFFAEPLAWANQYQIEREFQIDGMMSIDNLKKLLADHATRVQARNRALYNKLEVRPRNIAERRARAASMSADMQTREQDINDTLEYLEKNEIAQSLGYDDQLTRAYWETPSQRSATIAGIRRDVEKLVVEREKAQERIVNNEWEKCRKKLDMRAYNEFKSEFEKFENRLQKLMDQRSEDLIAWLQSGPFLDALTEFSRRDLLDGIAFENHVGEAIYGINRTAAGRAKLDAWIKEMKASEGNLIWRTLARNQDDAIPGVNLALEEAQRLKNEKVHATISNVAGYVQKTLKALGDVYKKSAGIAAANEKALAGTATAFGVPIQPVRLINLNGFDRWAATTGDRIFKYFTVAESLSEMASEKLIQYMFAIRGNIEHQAAISQIAKMIESAQLEREDTLAILRSDGQSKPVVKVTMQSSSKGTGTNPETSTDHVSVRDQKAAWGKAIQGEKAPAILRDTRIGFLVLFIEGVNTMKLLYDCNTKKDGKSFALLAASFMSIGAAIADIVATQLKESPGAESIPYQKFKFGGAVLSVGAGVIGVVFDVIDAKKSVDRGQRPLVYAYFAKAVLGLANVAMTMLATFTYAAPLIGRVTGSVAIANAAGEVGAGAAALLGRRILFMSVGVWISVLSFGVQIIIWVITDDALESWCSLCVFGTKKDSSAAYTDISLQRKELEKSLIEIGVL